MKKIVFTLLFLIAAIPSSFAQLRTHSFEEVERLSKENPKPIVVFIHTSWCKYCKMMENSTFKNPAVIKELNENFYFISLDAESKKEITFNNHAFRFRPTGIASGVHELATALATIGNRVVYPTLVVLDANYTILLQKPSYLNAKALLSILEKKEINPYF
ncbi:MAG TPA: thioredoxin family protein [Flavobacterium sp.]|uniref:thioredoxin family protein n=1 Tax=Flavobacterium sp. TaxID=239 RepID=UPI002F4102D6